MAQAKTECLAELKRLRLLVILAPVLGLLLIFSRYAAVTEFIYSKGIFLLLSNVWNHAFGIFPFSVIELLLYAAVIVLPALLLVSVILALFKRVKWIRLLRLIIAYILLAGALFASFYVLWGYNYYRQPLRVILSLDVRARDAAELEALCLKLRDAAKSLRENVSEDENGVFHAQDTMRASLNKIPPAYESMGERVPIADRAIAAPKPVLFSKGLSLLGIAGVYMPFTAEANVNVDQPHLLLLSSAAHEAAHTLGFARENEANFLAYLSCISSDDNDVRYSGVMLALIHCANALYGIDREAYYALRETYGEAINRDLENNNAYWASFEGPASEKMEKVNDNYLKFNSQETGVKSYGEVVDLLLAWYEKHPYDL